MMSFLRHSFSINYFNTRSWPSLWTLELVAVLADGLLWRLVDPEGGMPWIKNNNIYENKVWNYFNGPFPRWVVVCNFILSTAFLLPKPWVGAFVHRMLPYRVKMFNLSPFTATRPQKARIHTSLHAFTSGARLGNRSVFILDPRLYRTWVESRNFTFSLLCHSCLHKWHFKSSAGQQQRLLE